VAKESCPSCGMSLHTAEVCDHCGHTVCGDCYHHDFEACTACMQDALREKKAEAKKPKQGVSCKTCGWARWVMCKGGRRVNTSQYGTCDCPVDHLLQQLPACIRDYHFHKSAIWYRDNWGEGCTRWKRRG